MARALSQKLTRFSSPKLLSPNIIYCKRPSPYSPLPLSPRILTQRNRPTSPGRHSLSRSISSPSMAAEARSRSRSWGCKGSRTSFHSIIVRRSAPDWLPFIPGSSYWVPPLRRPSGIVELVGKLTNPLSDEENMSFTTQRGWPSAAYFIQALVFDFEQ